MWVRKMKTLSELAEDYKKEAERLKAKIEKLKNIPDYPTKNLKIYEEMYLEVMKIYYELRNYYDA